MSDLSLAALEVAKSQVGVQENPRGSNWGHPVQDYLLSVGINFQASWCMAFIYWCFEHAAAQRGQDNPLYKTGGVLAQWHNSQAEAFKKGKDTVWPGDVFIMDFGKGVGHTGIIESFDEKTGLLHTIEGNTNDSGAREGYEVCRRQRQIDNPLIIGFLKF